MLPVETHQVVLNGFVASRSRTSPDQPIFWAGPSKFVWARVAQIQNTDLIKKINKLKYTLPYIFKSKTRFSEELKLLNKNLP